VKYSAEATSGPGARDPLDTWVKSGVFHNTTGKTLQMGIIGTHSLYKNGLRLPKGCKAPLGPKWSDGVAHTAEHCRMPLDPSGRKPSRFPNKTPWAGPGPAH
jgi:hypothetical protein